MKKSAGTDHLPTATTRGTSNRARAWFSAAAVAFVARGEFRDLNLFFGAERSLLELDLHIVAQIGSAPPIFSSLATSEWRLPMNRLMEKMVRRGLVTACRLAVIPTSRSPLSVKATTEGVSRLPSWSLTLD